MSAQAIGLLQENIFLAKHTSWRVGGPAKYFYSPTSIDDLATFLQHQTDKNNIFWLGLGSNLLVRDPGYNGTVVSTLGGLQEIEQLDTTIIRAEAGVSCAKLARFSARLNLAGGEFWAGIPGSVGGALAMNAGCFGSETWEHVIAVETLSRQGERFVRKPSEYVIRYREVSGPDSECFVAAHLNLQTGNKDESLEKIRTLLERRANTQPTGDHSCGSVFRNPPGDYAARLIEASGLKGMQRGGALVSPKHANFIINQGNATATEIEELIEHVANVVQDKHGITLQREVKIIGDR